MRGRAMDKRGYTYVETLMAAMLLSIFIMPVTAGFFNAAANQRYSRDAYEASLYAGNLLTEAASVPVARLSEVTGGAMFDGQYKTERFDYCLYVFEDTGGGLELTAELYTGASHGVPSAPQVTGGLPVYPAPVAISGDSVFTGGTDVIIEGDTAVSVRCENTAPTTAVYNIYAAVPESVSVICSASGADIAVFVTDPPPRERVMMAEVYTKDGRLLNRLAVPVIG